jgi:hypothetical protein
LRKLDEEDFHNLYSSSNIIWVIISRSIRWASHVVCMGKRRNAYRILVGKAERKTPLGRPRRRWEGNVRMVLRQTRWEVVAVFTWIGIGTICRFLWTR